MRHCSLCKILKEDEEFTGKNNRCRSCVVRHGSGRVKPQYVSSTYATLGSITVKFIKWTEKMYRSHPYIKDILQEAYLIIDSKYTISLKAKFPDRFLKRCIRNKINDFIKTETLTVRVPSNPTHKVKNQSNYDITKIPTTTHFDFMNEEYYLHLLASLDITSIYIIEHSFGLNNKELMKQGEVAQILNKSIRQIRYIKNKALSILKTNITKGDSEMRYKNARAYNPDGEIVEFWIEENEDTYESEVDEALLEEENELATLRYKKDIKEA